MAIEIVRGTNPTISLKMKDFTLVPSFTEMINGQEVVRKSYATIRGEMDATGPIDTVGGELQIEVSGSGSTVDNEGNYFEVSTDTAVLKLSQTYTKKLIDGVYFLQFNLIDSDHNMFTIESRPLTLQVKPNLANL